MLCKEMNSNIDEYMHSDQMNLKLGKPLQIFAKVHSIVVEMCAYNRLHPLSLSKYGKFYPGKKYVFVCMFDGI